MTRVTFLLVVSGLRTTPSDVFLRPIRPPTLVFYYGNEVSTKAPPVCFRDVNFR